jgi:prepilin signal peptidase PulO-like enzyme (type II secretory pathway)
MENILSILLTISFGAIFGSYATLFAYRLPRGESCFGRFFGTKSRCPKCGSILKTKELIPLINWLITLGKCRNCDAKIPKTHLFAELVTTILFVITYLKFGFSDNFIIFSLISVCCVILIITEFTHKTFPYQILIMILFCGFASRLLIDKTIIDSIFSAFLGCIVAAFFYHIFYTKSQGFFSDQNHSFDYTKFILTASVCMNINQFLTYFLIIMIIFSILAFTKLPNSKNKNYYSFVLLIPFLWSLLH